MEHVRCDLCGADESSVERRQNGWTLVRCECCSLVYLDPRPEPEVMEKEFDWVRHAPLQTGDRRRSESMFRRMYRRMRGKGILRRKSREQVVVERIREYAPSGRLLDIGCGDGEILEALRLAGYDAHGLDISELAVRAAHDSGRTTVLRGTVQDAPFEPASFDVVLLMSYLEHEPRPASALQCAHDLLKPGGYLFVKVPHYGSWNRRVLGRQWSGFFFPQHLYYFTPRTIRQMFDKAGLQTVRNGFWDHVPLSDVMWATARRPLG